MNQEIKLTEIDIYNRKWWRLVTTAPISYDLSEKHTRTLCDDYVLIHHGHHDLKTVSRLIEVCGFENAEKQHDYYTKSHYTSYWLAELKSEALQFPDYFVFTISPVWRYHAYVDLSELVNWPNNRYLMSEIQSLSSYLEEINRYNEITVLAHDYGATYEIRVKDKEQRLKDILSHIQKIIASGRKYIGGVPSTTGVI